MEKQFSKPKDQAEQYAYIPLDARTKEIRLLRLLPEVDSTLKSNVRCEIIHASLDDSPLYEALSYVWGNPDVTVAISLNGRDFQVTEDLHTALLHLRQPDEVRVVWIDALCIDQNNISERTSQVAQMGSVYRQASKVVLFLGPEEEDLNGALHFFREFAANPNLHYQTSLSPHFTYKNMTFDQRDLRVQITRFLSLPWWLRLWTAQEFALAEEAVFQYGRHLVRASLIGKCWDDLRAHRLSYCKAPHRIFSWNHTNRQEGDLDAFNKFGNRYRLRHFRSHGITSAMEFLTWVNYFRCSKTSDPRDQIFALLGLLHEDLKDKLLPNYGHSTRRAYEEFAVQMIHLTESWDILSFAQRLPGDQATDSLPLFAPDWTARIGISHGLSLRWASFDLFDTCNGSHAEVIEANQGHIVTRAMLMDEIEKIATPNWRVQWQDLAPGGDSVSHIYLPDRGTLWQTTCGGILTDATGTGFRLAQSADFRSYEKWFKWCQSGKDESETDVRFFNNAWYSVTSYRNFATTRGGFIGFVPDVAEPGDRIVILPGGKVPYVLRRSSGVDTESSSTSGVPRYEFLGDAYIHGIMHGEAYDESKLERIILM